MIYCDPVRMMCNHVFSCFYFRKPPVGLWRGRGEWRRDMKPLVGLCGERCEIMPTWRCKCPSLPPFPPSHPSRLPVRLGIFRWVHFLVPLFGSSITSAFCRATFGVPLLEVRRVETEERMVAPIRAVRDIPFSLVIQEELKCKWVMGVSREVFFVLNKVLV